MDTKLLLVKIKCEITNLIVQFQHSHGRHKTNVNITGAVELLDNVEAIFRLGASIQPAVCQTISHAIALQNIQELGNIQIMLHIMSLNQVLTAHVITSF